MDTRSSPLTPGDGADGATGGADSAVTALYQAHAVGLIRLAIVMLGDRAAAEDVVQDAFFGLYRHWARLDDPANALVYVRSAVLNRCRNALRQRGRPRHPDTAAIASESAEAIVLVGEDDTVDGPHYICSPFDHEPGWGVSSINYNLSDLLQKAAAL